MKLQIQQIPNQTTEIKKDYNLIIQINSLGVVEKINARAKYNSVGFVDYTEIVREIFESFETDVAFNRFRFQLYQAVQEFVIIKRYTNGYRLESDQLYITPHILAQCLPKNIRRRYFKYDSFYEKYYLKKYNYHYL